MGTTKKLLIYQLQIKKKANFCKQNGLPPIRHKGGRDTALEAKAQLYSDNITLK